jgi:hypothetical protein
VYFQDGEGTHELTLETGNVEELGAGNLIDVAARVRLYQQSPDSIVAEQPLFDMVYGWPGEGRQLSEEGTLVLAWAGGALAIYDTRSGDEVLPNLGPDEDVIDAEFGPRNTITYLVTNRQQSNGIVNIRTCLLGPVFLSSGEPAPDCTEEFAAQYGGIDSDLQLAR